MTITANRAGEHAASPPVHGGCEAVIRLRYPGGEPHVVERGGDGEPEAALAWTRSRLTELLSAYVLHGNRGAELVLPPLWAVLRTPLGEIHWMWAAPTTIRANRPR